MGKQQETGLTAENIEALKEKLVREFTGHPVQEGHLAAEVMIDAMIIRLKRDGPSQFARQNLAHLKEAAGNGPLEGLRRELYAAAAIGLAEVMHPKNNGPATAQEGPAL